MTVNVVWFKRDLRLADHEPLSDAAGEIEPTILLYVIEPVRLNQPDTDPTHIAWELDCANELDKSLRKIGGSLRIVHSNIIDCLKQIHREHGINSIYSHQETGTTWSYERDRAVKKWCEREKVSWREYPVNGVVRGLKDRDLWKGLRDKRMRTSPISPPTRINTVGNEVVKPTLGSMGLTPRKLSHRPPPGEDAALDKLQSFLASRGELYRWRMSSPNQASHHCSRLSPYFSTGCLSIRTALSMTNQRKAKIREAEITEKRKSNWMKSLSSFQSRLAWHCHFIQKLEQEPTLDYLAMNEELDSRMFREYDKKIFSAWATGNTGWPFFDACMRQLISTGWINFRMRAMIMSVSSYTLWQPWRDSGLHLARLFLDYEPGIHWSQVGMQSGTTGINSIRAYSVLKQGLDHDPEGEFIKTWIPSLRQVPTEFIHEPWKMPLSIQKDVGCLIGDDYPSPIVDESSSRKAGVAKAYSARRSQESREASKRVYSKHGSRKRRTRKNRPKPEQSTQTKLF
jgi:deoxyribodipyrimidine photo-lyase